MSFLFAWILTFCLFLAYDAWRGFEDYNLLKRRKHFSRPSFSAYSDKDGLHINSGPNPDHATRCQTYLNDRGSQVPLYLLFVLIEALFYSTISYIVFGVMVWIFA